MGTGIGRAGMTVFTVGHSTHELDAFVAILRAYGIQQVVDVRTVPRSRHNPQFNKDALGKALRHRRINYRHMKHLGGRRHARRGSTTNRGWLNESFRGFADYMQTPAFDAALDALLALAAKRPTAIMCAEAVPWRCHRSLIGDALTARGVIVRDIFSRTNMRSHVLSPMAHVRGNRVTYPGEGSGGHDA
jgi:uncharacterized protein (DUF488 family)